MGIIRALTLVVPLLAVMAPAHGAPAIEGQGQDGRRVASEHAAIDLGDQNGDGLADGLEATLQGLDANEPVEVVVTLTRRAPRAEVEGWIGAFDLGHQFQLINAFSGTVTAGQARALANLPFVFRVEPVYDVHGIMEGSRSDTGVAALHAAAAVNEFGTGANIGICFVDSGVMTTHEMFNDANGVSKIAGYCNTIDQAQRGENELCLPGDVTTVEDDVGHGTNVAAVAAGDGTGSPYAEALKGIAPDAPIYVARALHADPLGLGAIGNDVDVEAAIEWCAQQSGVRVINLSVQGGATANDGLDSLSLIVNAAVQAGKVVVTGAGNSDQPHTIRPPAAAHLAIVTGAYGEWSGAPDFIAAADLLDELNEIEGVVSFEGEVARSALSNGPFVAPFSTRGVTSDGRIKPDILAPGHTIATAAFNPLPSILNCNDQCYDIVSGTSFSTPMVSGIVALILEVNPDLTPDGVRDILFSTAQDRGRVDANGNAVVDTNYGYGIVDAGAAVDVAAALFAGQTPDPTPTVMPSNYLTGQLTLNREQDYSVDFTISADEAASGVPLAVSVTGPLDGELYCIDFGFFVACEFQPDIDIWLAKEAVDGTYEVQWSSLCMLGGGNGQVQCGPFGLQETIAVPNPVAGNYRLIMRFLVNPGTPRKMRKVKADYEISWGPLDTNLWPTVQNAVPVADAGADFASGPATVTVDASGSDDADGSIVFYSWSGDGVSTGGPSPQAQLTLPEGTTTVTLTVVDDLGKSASDTVDITVTNAPPPPPPAGGGMYVWSIDLKKKRNLDVTVTIRRDSDGDGVAEGSDEVVAGATVSEVLLIHDSNGDGVFDDSCWLDGCAHFQPLPTDGKGQTKYKLLNAPSGSYQFGVLGLTHDSFTWDAALDVDNPNSSTF